MAVTGGSGGSLLTDADLMGLIERVLFGVFEQLRVDDDEEEVELRLVLVDEHFS